jgi:hypothetical protein
VANVATISIARDFSPFPAGRKRGDGPYTGETFREDILRPRLANGAHVILDIDGVEGLPSSFLEEVFGGLIRQGWQLADLKSAVEFRLTDPELRVYPPLAWRFAEAAASIH